MGKKRDQYLDMAIRMMQEQINAMKNPKSNPAQEALTNEALTGYEWLKRGDYAQKPTGMFFDFKNPVEQAEQYKKFANVNQGGTFALGDNAGKGQAQGLQSKYLSDKFARDASQNYQDNISNSAGNIRSALAGAAGQAGDQQAQIASAIGGFGKLVASMPQKTPWWQSLLSGVVGGASGGLGTLIGRIRQG